ncbi:MAG: acyltransferase family protein [Bacteroidota bacterium]
MKTKAARLYFIDAMRAWAILMMLQGHFIDGLLDTVFRDPESSVYTIWKYFRGITAPVFFTVSGFIFTYLLIRVPEVGLENPRVKKGLRRGLQLLLIGYLLRLNLFGLFKGQLYDAFYLVDVLHCIGLSILGIIGVYLLSQKARKIFPLLLLGITLVLFMFEPVYKLWTYPLLPEGIANYFTRANGSVFTIIPWMGYTAFGGFLSVLFTRFKNYKRLYPTAIVLSSLSGFALIFFSSDLFVSLSRLTGVQLFADIYFNNYLFIRLGDVLVVFAIFMIFRSLVTQRTVLRIGQNTLSIYVIHFIILYGSFTGLGLYRFFNHSLTPAVVIPGALAFMFVCSYAALQYDTHELAIKQFIGKSLKNAWIRIEPFLQNAQRVLKSNFEKVLRLLGAVKN